METVITEIVQSLEPAIVSGEPFPLINGLAGIHLSYCLMEKEVFWLAELSDVFSEVPKHLIGKEGLSTGQVVSYYYMLLHFHWNRFFTLKELTGWSIISCL